MFEKPGAEWRHINRGIYWEKYDEYGKAIACYARALRTDPQHAAANHRMGMALYATGQFEKALACLDVALKSGPHDTRIRLDRGMTLEKLHRYEEALACLESVDDHALDAETLISISSCQSGMGLRQEAIATLNAIPNNSDMLYARSRILGRMGDTAESARCLDEAIRMDSKESISMYEQGHEMTKQGRHEEAIIQYTKALKTDPKNVKALVAKAWTLDMAGFPTKETLPYLDDALKISHNDTEALMTRGLICDRKGMFDEAVKCFDHILKEHPDNVRALYSKGVSLYSLKKPRAARFFCQTALIREPDNVMALCTMVWLLEHEGEYQEALKHCDRALELNIKSVYALSYRAKILMAMGRYEESIKYYDRALDIDPGNRRAQYHRERARDKLAVEKRGSWLKKFRP